MPVSITKRAISKVCIDEMTQRAFGCEANSVEELTEGFFNIAYKVQVKDQTVILKVAPPMNVDIMTHEKNIMFSEVDAMRMVREQTDVPVPKILFYDDSKTICDSAYFFMEELKGCSFSSSAEQYSEEEKANIFRQVGSLTKKLSQIKGSAFGYYCQKDKQGKNWYEVFRSMIEDTYEDAKRKEIIRPVGKEKLLALLSNDRELFEEVKEPRFVHWDIWAGNVFVKDKEVVGIIDFERCLWADELMEVGFRTYGYEQGFFEGYEIKQLTRSQLRRAKWYDIYLFLIVSLECDYRQYDTKDAYHWACDMLMKWVTEMEKNTEDEGMIDTRCGLRCEGCEWKEPCNCGGCVATNGNPFHGQCPVAVCCQDKGLVHCGECLDFPCDLLSQYSSDPEHGDNPPGARIEQCRKWAQQ